MTAEVWHGAPRTDTAVGFPPAPGYGVYGGPVTSYAGTRWQFGDVILIREVHKDQVWLVTSEYVVEDTGDRLVTFIPPGAEFGFPDDHPLGVHPWKSHGHFAWTGHGSLHLHFPGQPWRVSVFWTGPDRAFECWYIDVVEPVRRFEGGLECRDQELDLVILPDGSVHDKDVELFEQEVRDGRFTAEEAATVRSDFARIRAIVMQDGVPVESHWAGWQPPADWGALPLPADWQHLADRGRSVTNPSR